MNYIDWAFDILDKFVQYHKWTNEEEAMNDVSKSIQNSCLLQTPNNEHNDYYKNIKYHVRMCGHILERLTTVYLVHNFKNIKEVKLKFIE